MSGAGWWMFHGDESHSGFVADSPIAAANVAGLELLHSLELDGPVLSTPAVVDGFVYVGTANSHDAVGSNGGSFYKIALASGAIAAVFHWDISPESRDSHGFCGMGCTPAVVDGRVYWSAFDGRVYCLDQATLELVWVVDLRHADPAHRQPVSNDLGDGAGFPPVAGWSSPLVVDGKVILGVGEGENPFAYGFVYCLDGATGRVDWLYCTAQFEANRANEPNVVPAELLAGGQPPPGFGVFSGQPVTKGCSVWSSPAWDRELDRLYFATGNPSPDSALPTPGWSNGLLVLARPTGRFVGFVQFPPQSSYRVSDIDVDVGGAPTLFTAGGRRLVGLGCKNGSYMTMDARTLDVVALRQMLPTTNDGTQIPTVDRHGTPEQLAENVPNPQNSNQVSNANQGENYSGTYSTAAVHAASGRLFVGLGGNNYHPLAPGIDTATTPFLRALDWQTLEDAWPLDDGDPRRYVNGRPPFYDPGHANESGLAVPAVVNDVVLMSTTGINLYAFAVADGTLLWQDQLGSETLGYNGGYGYCLGPAVWREYVVAGALAFGRQGGILNVYRLPAAAGGGEAAT